ncbi:MAG: hypothetical protein SOY69_01015 [Alloprevotella sp.]|nr:hypothetical protein [Alloprevotella sp.]
MRNITYLLTLLLLSITGLGVNAQKPFEVSGAPATTDNGGRWATNVKWYFLHFVNSDAYHTAGYMGTSGDQYINANGQLLLNGTDKPMSSAGLWCFVGSDEAGYKFYNRNTGISKVLSVTTGGVAKMLVEGTDGQMQLFDYAASTSVDANCTGKATFKFHGNGNYYLNNSDGAPKCHVAVWNDPRALGDKGSAIDVVEATYDELVEMGLKVKLSTDSEKFYFYIKNARSGKYAAFNGSTGLTQVEESNLTNNALWYYTSDGKLHNMGTDKLVNGKTMDETGCTMYIEENILKPGYFCISTTADYTENCWDDASGGIGYYYPRPGNFVGTSWSIIYSTGSIAKDNLIKILNKAKQAIGTNPGFYPQSAVDAAQAVLDDANSGDSQYTTAATTLSNAMVVPTQGKYYAITSAYDQYEIQQGVTKSIYADSEGNVKWKTTDLTDDAMFWEIYEDNGKYVFKNYGTKTYISTYSDSYKMGEAAANSSFTWFEGGICNINIVNGNLHTAGHNSGSGQDGNVIKYGSGADGASAWYIKEVKEPDLQKSITRLENGVNEYKKYTSSNGVGINPGQYTLTSGSVEALQAQITAAETLLASGSATSTECDNALSNLMGAAVFSKNEMTVGCYYRIQSTSRSTYTGLQTNDAKMGTSKMWNYALNEVDPSQIWKLEKDGENYFLVNLASGLYPQYVNGGSDATTYVGEKNAEYKFTWDIYAEATETSMPIHRIYFGGRQVNIEPAGYVNWWTAEHARHYIWKVAKTEEEILTLVKNWATSQNMTANASAPKISLEDNVTQVISPNEFAAPAVVNAAIDIIKAYNEAGNPTLEQAQALYNNYKIVDTYAQATNTHGSILSVPYTLKAQYGTIILPINYLKPNNVKLYSCDGEENGVLTLTEYTEGQPKNKPYIIEYTDEATMPTAEDPKVYQLIGYSNGAETTNQQEGWLTGVLQDETCYVPDGSYILSKYNDKLGFYQVEGDNVKVAAKYKCYLTINSTVQSAPKALFFDENDTVTDITNIFGGENNQRIEIYNLAGQRIHRLQKGVNIVNGKKVIVR